MFLAESKLRNLIRSVVYESLLKEDIKIEQASALQYDMFCDKLKNVYQSIINNKKYAGKIWNSKILESELQIINSCIDTNTLKKNIKKFKKNYPFYLITHNEKIKIDELITNTLTVDKIIKLILQDLNNQLNDKNKITGSDQAQMVSDAITSVLSSEHTSSDFDNVMKKIQNLYTSETKPEIKAKWKDLSSKVTQAEERDDHEFILKVKNQLKTYKGAVENVLSQLDK